MDCGVFVVIVTASLCPHPASCMDEINELTGYLVRSRDATRQADVWTGDRLTNVKAHIISPDRCNCLFIALITIFHICFTNSCHHQCWCFEDWLLLADLGRVLVVAQVHMGGFSCSKSFSFFLFSSHRKAILRRRKNRWMPCSIALIGSNIIHEIQKGVYLLIIFSNICLLQLKWVSLLL